MEVLGKVHVDVQHCGKMHRGVHIHVIKGEGISLLGRDLLTSVKLKLAQCKQNWKFFKQSFKKLYTEPFSSKLGKMNNF